MTTKSELNFHALFSSAPALSRVARELPDKDKLVVDHWRTWCKRSGRSQTLQNAPSALEPLIAIIDRLTKG